MEIKRYEFILEASTPIAHHSESFGNSAIVMRRKVRQPDGTWRQVPVVTGDTMRHGLREAAAYAFLDAAGLLDEGQLGEAALRLLFAGGMLTERGDAANIKLDHFREMCELCPPLALLGGCADNRMIPGRLAVDDAILICSEQHRYLPDWVTEWKPADGTTVGEQLDTCRASLEEVQRVRMDPVLDPGKRKLLLPDAAVEVSHRLASAEGAHEANDAMARDESKSSMMPRRFERMAQGSLFYWSATCNCYSELDVDTFHTMLGAFLANACVGGKRGTGHGKLRAVTARNIEIRRPSQRVGVVDVGSLGPRVGQRFVEHVAQRKEQIRTWLSSVNA